MSAMGQKQTYATDLSKVRFVPGPDIRLPALCGDLTFHHVLETLDLSALTTDTLRPGALMEVCSLPRVRFGSFCDINAALAEIRSTPFSGRITRRGVLRVDVM
jgi:hypothetical protein